MVCGLERTMCTHCACSICAEDKTLHPPCHQYGSTGVGMRMNVPVMVIGTVCVNWQPHLCHHQVWMNEWMNNRLIVSTFSVWKSVDESNPLLLFIIISGNTFISLMNSYFTKHLPHTWQSQVQFLMTPHEVFVKDLKGTARHLSTAPYRPGQHKHTGHVFVSTPICD